MWRRAFLGWCVTATALTGISLALYSAVQQNYRQSLNDPQVQMAEDAAQALSIGGEAASIVPNGAPVEIARSLASWIAVYDKGGHLVASSGVLDGAPINIPSGVLQASAQNAGKDTNIAGQNRVTWQPREGVRSAIVAQYYSSSAASGFVVAGRNMREVEKREDALRTMVVLLWILILCASFITQLFVEFLRRE